MNKVTICSKSRTIPVGLETKKGTSGTLLELRSNYFALKKLPNWTLYQYRVDMSPEIDYTKVGTVLIISNVKRLCSTVHILYL